MSSEGKNLVGVDIGSSSIKVCEIEEKRKGQRTLVRFGLHPLPPQTVVDGHVMNAGAIVEGLDRLFHKQKRREVALRASGHSVIIKKITMPMMTPEELDEQIGWEAEQHIPFELSDVQIDYQVLTQRAAQGQMDVLLVAAKKEELSDLTNLALQAKLKPRVVDLDAFAVQNCFEVAFGAPQAGQTIVLLHVGASLTTLNILSGGVTAFTRDIANGGNAITEEIQRRLNISQEEAEAFKCGGAKGLVPKEVPEIVAQSVEGLAGEIQRSLDFYLATSGDRDVDRIVISGGTGNVAALRDSVARRARVAVELLDVTKVAAPDTKRIDPLALQGRELQAVVACGLALRKDREQTS
jgi:type IV pilus assembly protein PilM